MRCASSCAWHPPSRDRPQGADQRGAGMSFVLDNSVAMCWLLADGKPADGRTPRPCSMRCVSKRRRWSHRWALEASNVIAGPGPRGAHRGTLAGLRRPPAATEHRDRSRHPRTPWATPAPGPALQAIGVRRGLSGTGPAAGLPLATLDADLEKAAQAAGVEAFAPELIGRRAVAPGTDGLIGDGREKLSARLRISLSKLS